MIAKGLSIRHLRCLQQTEPGDVAVGDSLDGRDDVGSRRIEQVRVAALQLQVVLDGLFRADGRYAHDVAVFGFEDREQPGLLGQPCNADGVGGRAGPSQRARHEDMQVSRPAKCHGATHFVFEVAQFGHRRRGHVGDFVGHRDEGKVFFP